MPGRINIGTDLGLNTLLGVKNIETTILFFFAAIATIEQAIFALINPHARWSTLKQAERLMNSEIWKFRCRMGN